MTMIHFMIHHGMNPKRLVNDHMLISKRQRRHSKRGLATVDVSAPAFSLISAEGQSSSSDERLISAITRAGSSTCAKAERLFAPGCAASSARPSWSQPWHS